MMDRIAQRSVEGGRAESTQRYLDSVRQAIPAGRMADPGEISAAGVCLVERSMVEGATPR